MPTKSSTALVETTGHDYDHWFAALDAWDAGDRTSAQARAWLRDQHGVSAWWAQKLIVEYEQLRGRRVPGARPDGTVTVGVSRTVRAPADETFAAITDPELRRRWLPDLALMPRPTTAARTARFDGPDGTRVTVTVAGTAADRATVSVEHERLPRTVEQEENKAAWVVRLEELRGLLADASSDLQH